MPNSRKRKVNVYDKEDIREKIAEGSGLLF